MIIVVRYATIRLLTSEEMIRVIGYVALVALIVFAAVTDEWPYHKKAK